MAESISIQATSEQHKVDAILKNVDSKKVVDDEIQIVVFQLDTEEFGIDITKVKEIIKVPDITRVPNSSKEIEGVINVRGEIIEVANLCLVFSLAAKKIDDNTRIIEIENGKGSTMGVLVDSVKEVMRLSKKEIKDTPKIITQKIDEKYIDNVGLINNRIIILLNLAHLFDN